jgi:amino acid adenylation domain-containing protein
VAKEQEYFTSKKYQKDKAFWSEMYAEHPEYVRLKPNAMTSTSPSANRLYAEASPALSAQFKAFCTEHEYSPATVFEAAMLIYLDRINGGGKMPSLGLAVLNRDGAKDKRTLGMFISTIPLTAKPSEDKTLGELCAEINDLHLQIFRHQKYPYSHILSDIHQHHGDVEKLFDVTVSYQTAQADKSAMAQSHWYGNGYCENTLNFHVDDRDNSGLFHINIDYQVQQFDDQAEVGLLKDRILYIIEQIVSNSAKTIGQTGIISPIEYDLITNIFNQTSQPLPHKSVIDLFGEQVKNAPDQIALVCQGKGVTYSELDKQSNQIANFLIEKDITKGDIVAVSLPRVNISIACILGILKVGAVYLPIDPANPQERIEYILTNSLAKLYITEASLEKCMSHNDSKPIIDVTENDLCYCIYTSGTTGNPKGVAISHHNLLSYIESCKGIYGSDHVNMPYFTAPFVDLTVTSIYLPLLTGGTIYLYPEEVYHSIPQIIENSDLSIIKLTPTHLQLFNQCGNCKELPHISHLILGGENLLAKDCFEFLSRYGAHIKIHNEYGPTETTVGCTDYVYSPNDHALSVPIGHPTANTQLYILDSSMRITPVGIQGELCVAGDGVGMGYLNNPDLTKTFFIPNPFGKGVIYKTGDIAYWSSDGNIVYVGRRDEQVKIHGVRIELGEIEAAVLEHPNILQASAVVLNTEVNPQVCVYYTASDEVNSNDIRNRIAHRLPRQMLPALFVRIDSMPIASGGKVNKKALPIPDFSKSKPMTEYSAPQTELEKQVSNIIEQLLNISRVSIDDDLFDCGLNSLKVIEFIITLQKEGISLNAQDVYNHPSVRSLSTFVENHLPQINAEDSNRSNLRDVMEASLQTKNKAENVFLTGATGFLGIHVLKELYKTTDKTIYCLIRDPKKFESAIVYYTDIPYPNERIICFCGDITEASLGLKSNEYELLCNDIGDIIHCAATVSLFGAWETSKRINYSGTCNVIALAEKASAKLHHISTISVSGDMIVPQEKPHCEFSENDLYIGQSYTENVYVHSKYLAEEAVISAIRNATINASIYRIGHVLWDSHTGLFQINYQSNDVYMLMDAFRTIGKLPAEFATHKMPIIPVNECARIICHELNADENRVYHLYDDSITWGEFMAALGVSEHVSFAEFIAEAQKHKTQTVKFAELFLSAIVSSNGQCNVNVVNAETKNYLNRHNCSWYNMDSNYVMLFKDN